MAPYRSLTQLSARELRNVQTDASDAAFCTQSFCATAFLVLRLQLLYLRLMSTPFDTPGRLLSRACLPIHPRTY